jgi:hypothetical protein
VSQAVLDEQGDHAGKDGQNGELIRCHIPVPRYTLFFQIPETDREAELKANEPRAISENLVSAEMENCDSCSVGNMIVNFNMKYALFPDAKPIAIRTDRLIPAGSAFFLDFISDFTYTWLQ